MRPEYWFLSLPTQSTYVDLQDSSSFLSWGLSLYKYACKQNMGKVSTNHCMGSIFSLRRYLGRWGGFQLYGVNSLIFRTQEALSQKEKKERIYTTWISSQLILPSPRPPSTIPNPTLLLLLGLGPTQDKPSSCQRKWSLQVANFFISKMN